MSDAEIAPLPLRWSALLDGIAARYHVAQRRADWLCLSWPSTTGDWEQTVQVTCRSVHGQWRVFLTADICYADGASEADALDLASKLLVGSLVIQNGVLALRCILTEGGFTPPQLDETIMRLQTNAVRFRERLLQRKAAAGRKLFDAFVD